MGLSAAPAGGAPAAATTAPAAGGGAAAPAANTKPAAGGKLQLPTYQAANIATPDVPGADTIPDGYSAYPANPKQSVPKPPGDGGDIDAQHADEPHAQHGLTILPSAPDR